MLSILCVTASEAHSAPFLIRLAHLSWRLSGELVIGVDGDSHALGRVRALVGVAARLVPLRSEGYVESVLDQALAHATRKYVLRLDDDEAASPAMVEWLDAKSYLASDHWKFPRLHLWGDEKRAIRNAPLWTDHQTRLSVRGKSGGRTTVHAGSPHGGGKLAPVCIEHHKFLVKTRDERRQIAERYDAYRAGYGTGGFLPFNLPEEVWSLVETVDRRLLEDAAVVDASVEVLV